MAQRSRAPLGNVAVTLVSLTLATHLLADARTTMLVLIVSSSSAFTRCLPAPTPYLLYIYKPNGVCGPAPLFTYTQGPACGTAPLFTCKWGPACGTAQLFTNNQGPACGTAQLFTYNQGPACGAAPLFTYNQGPVCGDASLFTYNNEGPAFGTTPLFTYNQGPAMVPPAYPPHHLHAFRVWLAEQLQYSSTGAVPPWYRLR